MATRPMAAPSIWWSPPGDPADFFGIDELSTSAIRQPWRSNLPGPRHSESRFVFRKPPAEMEADVAVVSDRLGYRDFVAVIGAPTSAATSSDSVDSKDADDSEAGAVSNGGSFLAYVIRSRRNLLDSTEPRSGNALLGRHCHHHLVVDPLLLDQPEALRRFVIAHELAHLKRDHLRRRRLFSLVAAVVGGLGALAAIRQLVEITNVEFFNQPNSPFIGLLLAGLGVAVGVATSQIPSAWFARVQERSADLEAVSNGFVVPNKLAVALYDRASTNLYPGLLERLLSPHLSPADRLEFLTRARRAFSSDPYK